MHLASAAMVFALTAIVRGMGTLVCFVLHVGLGRLVDTGIGSMI